MSKRLLGRKKRYGIESLESRRTPSTASAPIALVASAATGGAVAPAFTTSPADGEAVEASRAPDVLVLRLEGAGSSSLTFYGIALYRVEVDGTETTILDGYTDVEAQLDPATGTIRIELGTPLDVGRYRVVLDGGSGLSQSLAQGRWDWTQDQTLSQFEVTRESERGKGVENLGAIGPKLRVATGSLPEGAAGEASYRIQLAGNQRLWRLGLQLDAGRIGSDLLASMSLYDAAGRLVASARVGGAVPQGVPNDPYLFVGLPPGEYQVVVSKTADQPGGDFRLNLVADPATEPTRVTEFTVDRTNGAPTGFSIAFSSPINPGRLTPDAIRVVDATGAVHIARLSSLDPSFARMSFAFEGALPVGEYRLLAEGDEPLADLVGRIPTVDGLPSATLARWTVDSNDSSTRGKPSRTAYGRGDLGLRPRTSALIPLTITAESSLALQTITTGTVSVEVLGSDGSTIRELGVDSSSREYAMILPAGSYVIRLTATGRGPARLSWRIDLTSTPASYFIGNAIGNRGMIDVPMRRDGGEAGPPAARTGAAPTSTTPRMNSTAATVAAASGRIDGAYAAGSLAAATGSTPLGMPSTSRDDVPVVGPTVPGGGTAVAWAAPTGRGRAISTLILSLNQQADDGLDRGPAGLPEPKAQAPTSDEPVARAAGDGQGEGGGDASALRQAERAAGLFPEGLRWLFDGPEAAPTPTAPSVGNLVSRAVEPGEAGPQGPDGASDGKVERASLEVPLSVLFITTSTFHLRRAALRWWRRRKAATAGPLAVPEPRLYRGPRRMVPSAGRERSAEPRRG
ncbi:hypothetical protein [Paludisphaera soli]|uniref:hypothetical protein n=1 Tax=Paludisphaera soli TaxID=2712865 RepID=UPI0013EB67D5|nr:hypothetical protein [Paludisphaera soli]